MTFISYAQNFEDVMLWRALKHVDHGFYIDIGACWPDMHSVTCAFYERGWCGINIEPNPEFLQQLSDQRSRDINLGFAISDEPGHARMTIVDGTGLSTLDETIAKVHLQSGYSPKEQDVELVTLGHICETYVPAAQPIHFLKVDVEGLEAQVLRGHDWQSYRPWLVVVEATVPLSQVESYEGWESILTDADYRLCYADGLNRFYVAEERAELSSAFDYPPNVFDEFETYTQSLAQANAAEAVSQLAGERRAREEERRAREQVDSQLAEERRAREQVERELELERETRRNAEAELVSVYGSNSWRVTWPLRKAMVFVKWLLRLSTRAVRGLMGLPKASVRLLLSKSMTFVLRRDWLKQRILQWVNRHPRLKQRLKALARDRSVLPDHHSTYAAGYVPFGSTVGPEMKQVYETLTPRARSIYDELKTAIEKKAGEHR